MARGGDRHVKKIRCSLCRTREMYVLAGTTTLVCRTCDWAAIDNGPVRPLREQGAQSA
jgi:hypothetical protein